MSIRKYLVLVLVVLGSLSIFSSLLCADEIQTITVYGRITARAGTRDNPNIVSIPMAELNVQAYRYGPTSPRRDPIRLDKVITDSLGNYILRIRWNVTTAGERLSNVFVLAYSYSGPYFHKVAGVEIVNGVSLYREDFDGPSVSTLWEGEFVTITGKVVDSDMKPLEGADVYIKKVNNPSNQYYFHRPVATNKDGSFRFHVAWNNMDEAGASPLSGRGRIKLVAKTANGKVGATDEILLENPRILNGDESTWNTVETNSFIIAR